MKNLNFKFSLIVLLCFLATSCETEQQPVNLEKTELKSANDLVLETKETKKVDEDGLEIIPEILNTKVAILSRRRKGKFIELFNKYKVESYSVRAATENLQDKTGFLYIDADDFVSGSQEPDAIITNAQSNGLHLIIESGSNNKSNVKKFLVNNFDIDQDLNGLVIINNQLDSSYVPLDDNTTGQTIFDIFSLYFYAHLPEPTNDGLNKFDSNQTEDKTKTSLFAREEYNYVNATDAAALSAAKAKYGGGSACSWDYTGYKMIDALQAKGHYAGKSYVVALKRGDIHFSNGCRGQQTASYSNTFTVSKTWSVRIGGKVEVNGPFWKVGVDVSRGFGGGKSKSTTNGSSTKMYQQYARPYIGQRVQLYVGKITAGKKELNYRVCCKGDGCEDASVRIRYDNHELRTTQPKGPTFYGWSRWGKWLKKC